MHTGRPVKARLIPCYQRQTALLGILSMKGDRTKTYYKPSSKTLRCGVGVPSACVISHRRSDNGWGGVGTTGSLLNDRGKRGKAMWGVVSKECSVSAEVFVFRQAERRSVSIQYRRTASAVRACIFALVEKVRCLKRSVDAL